RARIIDDARPNIGQPTVLVDGFVRGTWKIARRSGAVTLTVTPFERFSKKDYGRVGPRRQTTSRVRSA
ncbi:MAG TPA: crosslink repair DNA glycosylase YcaQ family protein, partial [Bryobacteraceae bacterium]|nr:crosslink repair DNA glycosylase YcaQ family protein [Bryobacteraceae bacterium]